MPKALAAILLGLLLAGAAPSLVTVQAWPDVEVAEQDPREAVRQAEESVIQTQAAGDKRNELQALRRLTLGYAYLGEFKEHRELFDRGLALAREVDEAQPLTWFIETGAWLKISDGQPDEALALLDEAASVAESRNPLRLPWIYLAKGDMLSAMGRTGNAMQWLPKAYDIFQQRGDRYGMGRTLTVIGSQVRSRPDADAADLAKGVEDLRKARELLDPKYRIARSQVDSTLGAAYYRLKDYPRARPLLEDALATHQALGRTDAAAVTQCRLGLVDRDEGRAALALGNLGTALPKLQRLAHPMLYVECLMARAEALAQLGRKRDALRELANVADEVKRIDDPQLHAGYYSRAAVIYAAQEDFREAYQAMVALAEAKRRVSDIANRRITAEFEARFGAQLMEAENARLRAEQKEGEARRFAVLLLPGVALILLASFALQLRRRAAHHRTLASVADIGHAIAAMQSEEEVFKSLQQKILELVKMDSVVIWLVAGGQLRRRFAAPPDAPVPEWIPLDDATAPAAQSARERRDILRDERVIYLPLAAGSDVIGVLAVASRRKVEERELSVVRTLATYGGVALANIANEQRLRALSLRDSLTGLYNRRGLLVLAEQQVPDWTRTGRGYAVVFVDMDGMKKINDNLGHQEGDRALIDTAKLIRETFRQSDIKARLGGDEFAIVMAEDPKGDWDASTAATCERLEEAVARHNITAGRPYKLSLSLGVSRSDANAPQSIEAMLESSDQAMFERKRAKGAARA